MARNTSVELGDEMAGFVDTQVKAGRYRSVSEVIRAGIRLLQNEETRFEALRQALKHGEDSGEAVPFDMDKFIASHKGKRVK